MVNRGQRALSRRAKAVVTSVFIGIALMLATGAQANSLNAHVQQVNGDVQKFASMLGRFDDIEQLAAKVPLSEKPLAELLQIDKIFDDDHLPAAQDNAFQSIKERLDAAADTSWENLAGAIDGLDCSAADCGVEIKVTGPGAADDANDDVYVHDSNPSDDEVGTVDIAFELKVSKSGVPVPVSFSNDLVKLAGGDTGTFPLDIEFKTTVLHFQVDKAKLHGDPGVQAQALALRLMPTDTAVPDAAKRVSPAVLFSASATNANIGSFNADLGFTQVSVNGTASFDFDGHANFLDPDDSDGPGPVMGDGLISADEWHNSGFATLLSVGIDDDNATNAVDATIRMDSTLVPNQLDGPDGDSDNDHDASIHYTEASLADGVNPTVDLLPDASFGQVGNFRNMTPSDAVAAVLRLVQFLDGLQATNKLDVNLPHVGGANPNPNDPADSPEGTFSDALRIGAALKAAVLEGTHKLTTSDDPATAVKEASEPTFTNVQKMAEKLSNALGVPGLVVPAFVPANGNVPARLDFTLGIEKTASKQVVPDFDNLDILSGISITSSPINLNAAYDLSIPFALSLKKQPVEAPGAPVGSCRDEQDNDGDTKVDADDPECATDETIQQRVGIKVGTGAADDVPEIVASARVDGTGIGANAKIGILEAKVENAELHVSGKPTGEGTSNSDTIATCSDDNDNDNDNLKDGADPDCNAVVKVDFKDTADGFLTVEDLFNTLGAGNKPPTASFTAVLNGAFSANVPVKASVGSTDLAGGAIKITANAPNVDLLSGAGVATLVESLKIDASSVHATDLFNFSPCSNNTDDDGDGDKKVNDGCEQEGATAEAGAQCENNTNDDSTDDSVVNDGCPANDDPETSSSRLFNQIIEAVKAVTASLEASGLVSGDQQLPLIDKSFNELVGYVETLESIASGMSAGAENSLELADDANPCEGSGDDDKDGYANDGCPSTGTPEHSGISTQGTQCAKGNTADDDGDGKVNDGCPVQQPTLNDIRGQIEELLDNLFDQLPGAVANDDHATVALKYEPTDKSIRFDIKANPSLSRDIPLNLALGGGAGSLVSLDANGGITAGITGQLDLDFGIEINGFKPFLLDTSGVTIDASAEGRDLSFQAGVGPIKVLVGDTVKRPEGACADSTDDDGDGFVNDGCPAQDGDDDPENDTNLSEGDIAGACARGNTANDDSADDDDFVNDGCPAEADPASFDLQGAFSAQVKDEGANDDHKLYLSDIDGTDFDVSVGGKNDPDCKPVATQNAPANTDKHACAVLPLFFDADGPDGAPPVALGNAPTQGHQLRVNIVNLASPTPDFNNYDFNQILNKIGQQLIDMLLLESGLQNILDLLKEVLNGQLFGFKLPFIGDQLSKAADVVDVIEQNLLATLTGQMNNANPLNGLTASRAVQEKLDQFASTVGGALASAGVLLNSAGTGVGSASDFKVELRCKDSGGGAVGPCDTGGEDDAFNLAAGPSGGSAANCDNKIDDDNDGFTNDGCEKQGSFNDPDCTNADDEADEDPADGDPVQDDEKTNDGCGDQFKHDATEVYDIRFVAKIGRVNNELFSKALNFDVGVPGLGLKTEDAVLTGKVDWKLDIGFGVSKDPNLGFYVVTDPTPNTPDDVEEVTAGGTLKISSSDTDPAKIKAQLGFLKITAYDGDPTATCATTGSTGTDPCRPANDTVKDDPSSFKLFVGLNVKDPDTSSPDGLLAFNELGTADFGDILAFRLGAKADLNFHVETSIAGTGATLPRLFADLHLDWNFSVGATETGAPDGSASSDVNSLNPGPDSQLEIYLDGITLDAGTFITKFLKPILGDVQRFTKPLQPLIDKLQAPIPVLSDLAGEPITLLDLAQQLAPDTYNVDLIVAAVKIIDFINTFDLNGSGNFQIPLGDRFDLAGASLQKGDLAEGDARKAFSNLGQLDGLDANPDALLNEISNRTAAPNAPPEKTVGTMTEIGVKFPFLEQPSKLLGILFKQDVDLITFEAQLSVGFSYSQKFGPIWSLPPVFLEIGGSLSAYVKFGIGYDTQGLRELLFENASPDALLHGLFLIDYPGNEAQLRGELFANAQVSVLIFSAGAGGSVYLTIGIDLNDPNNDGKLKWTEAADILRTTGSPLCLFELNGQFGVRIFVFAEVDLFFWSQRWEKTLADIVLFEFKVACDPLPDPVLAHAEGSGDSLTLVLHMGEFKGLRDTPANSGKSIGSGEETEKFVVTTAKLPHPVTKVVTSGLTVESFGVTQFYPGDFKKVLAKAGDKNDVITMADGVAGAETQCSNNTDDDNDGTVNDGCPRVKGANDTVEGGAPETSGQCAAATQNTPANNADDDNDGFVNDGCKTIGDPLPFNIATEIHGGSGNDQITAGVRATAGSGQFDDKLYGNDGDDQINAREGRNLVVGGEGKDKVTTGYSVDTIWGDNENNDPAPAGSNDAEKNADTLDAGAAGDTIHGGHGSDTINGGQPHKIPKTSPATVIADGVDTINGNEGFDTIEAGDDADVVDGGPDGDRINGGNGEDIITGGDEANDNCANIDDTLIGGPDADTISAGGGDDVVVGGNTLSGQPDSGDKKLDGGDGCDYLYGDNATPNPDGSSGRVLLLIDPSIGGPDKMAGGNGNDTLRGQKDDDTIRGDDFLSNNFSVPDDDANDGDDWVFGDDGADRLFGDGQADKLFGWTGADDMSGGLGIDELYGEGGEDVMIGDDGYVTSGLLPGRSNDVANLKSSGDDTTQLHKDTMHGGTESDRMYGELSSDTMRGDEHDDVMYGNEENDVMNGNTGHDLMFGNNGADDMFGDAGNDRMIGGSPDATTDDKGKDEMYGRFGQDIMAGDNATISPAGTVTLLAETTANKGDGDLMYGEEHEDRMYGGLGNDTMYGNADDDYMEGNADKDAMEGNGGDDDMLGGTSQAGPVSLVDSEGEGGQLDDVDTMKGGSGHDVMAGDNGRIVRTGNPSPILSGAEERDVELFDLDSTDANLNGGDVMDGNSESDELYGGGDVDTMHGNGGDDHLEGNPGADKVWGDADQDDLVGGTSAEAGDDNGGAHPDEGDELFGDNGSTSQTETAGSADVVAGDNASILRVVSNNAVVTDNLDPTRPGYSGIVRRVITLYDLQTVASPNPTAPGNQAVAGGETIYAEGGPDIVYGQGGGDTLHGQDKDDYLEGNAGNDFAYGEAGQDDLLGGTGRTKSDDPASADNGRLDGVDKLYGGNGVVEDSDEDTGSDALAPSDSDDFDVLMGDNATILRDLEPAQGDHVWEVNTFNASIRRRVFLYDVATHAAPAAATNGTSGADVMAGEADADVMYGQGAGDTMDGNGDDDYMEGNEGVDTIRGGVGSDDMLGGTGRINGEGLDVDGRLDSGETLIDGGQGFDVMAGDNAVIARVLNAQGQWVQNTYNRGVQHERIFLRDLDDTLSAALPGTSGGEVLMTGATEDDVMYGQGGNDTMAGNNGSDYIEGNEANDAISGNAGEDDIVGGTGRVNFDGPNGTDGRFDGGDTISGEAGTGNGASEGDGGDVVMGDNSVIERPLDGAGKWRQSKANAVTTRRYVVRDLATTTFTPAAGTAGGDTVYGNDNDDVLYGQGAVDTVSGGAGDDYIEGGLAGDTLNGGPNQDDIIGGTGRDFDEETWIETTPPQQGVDGRLDGNDTINGGTDADFELGDNGLIQRRENADGTWKRFVDANPDTIVRVATRRDVAGPVGTWGHDTMNGDEGDDVMYGQDGTDTMHGDAENNVFVGQDNDDMYGELGNDYMYGDEGEDAMIGDRGNIVNTRLKDDSKKIFYDTQGPAFFKYTGLVKGQLDRRVSLQKDGDDAPGDPSMGEFVGGEDRMRGGPGHDSMHGAFEDDLMNGDSGGDWLFGDDGADAMWGGKGADPSSIDPADHIKADDGLDVLDPARTRGKFDRFLDYMFGSHGGLQTNEVEAADKMDFRPRAPGAGFEGDPAEWFVMTSTNDADVANNQHHQGIDWIYGGWDRDAMEGNYGKNGPDFGDRLIDWKGAYNMYTRCNASYGDDGDIYQITPQLMELLQAMAYGSGAGESLTEVKTRGTSGFRELGLVYPNDPGNHGKAFPTTPGHFEKAIDCSP